MRMADTLEVDTAINNLSVNTDVKTDSFAEVNSPSYACDQIETSSEQSDVNTFGNSSNENGNFSSGDYKENCNDIDDSEQKNDEIGLEEVNDNGNSDEISKVKKSNNKRVVFPADSNLVRGYLDPPDPWKDVPNWRTEDLVRAYKRGCEKHGTKPLNKVLQQLQCIENVGERYEILSLKGERLDLKQCESLEEILKHVRFRCIDLEATHLDDEMAVAIFEMVEYYESACKLNISFNKAIGPRGWMSCSKLIRKTPCLTFIDARNCDLNDRVIPILGRALRMGCFLQRLHLQNAGLAGRALIILVAAVKMNETLKELFLGDNRFMPTDGVQIGNLLKYNHKLELLDLRNNHLQDVGIGHICDGLAEHCGDTGLLTLVLWNNQITFQGMTAINKALTSAEHLETLNLGHNPITNEGIHILKDGLLKTKGLLKLGLSGTKVSCEGAVALAEVIADNTRLVRLDLQENEIKTAGMMALSLALKVNESITRLDLDRDTKKESGVKDYADQQKRLQAEISSLLERNREFTHKREQERLELEEKNKENARKLQEAAGENSMEEPHPEYIPSGDSIHRPKLLFLPLTTACPEHELDSPVLGENFSFEVTSPVQAVHLSSPATSATDLLSPQYCPNPKATAKKIFSVTKVTSPTQGSPSLPSGFGIPAVSSVINSPTQVHPPVGLVTDSVIPHLVSPLPAGTLPSLSSPDPLLASMNVTSIHTATSTSPSTLQKVIEEHTLVSYIQQIVENSDAVNELHPVQTSDHSNLDHSAMANKLVSICDLSNNSGKSQNSVNDNHNLPEKEKKHDDSFNPTDENADKELEQELGISDISAMKSDLENTSSRTDEPESEVENLISEIASNCDTEDHVEQIEAEQENVKSDSLGQCDSEKEAENMEEDSTNCDIVNDTNIPEGLKVELEDSNPEKDGNGNVVDSGKNISETGTDNDEYLSGISTGNDEYLSGMSTDNDEYLSGISTDNDRNVIDERCSRQCTDENEVSSQDKTSSVIEDASLIVQNDSDPASLSELDMPLLSENGSGCETSFEPDLKEDYVDCINNIEPEVNPGVNGEGGNNVELKDDNDLMKDIVKEEGCDVEPWNTVNESDLDMSSCSEPLNTQRNIKPDFHTNLTFNGLRQELASLIDEESGSAQSPVTTDEILKNGGSSAACTSNGADTESLDTEVFS